MPGGQRNGIHGLARLTWNGRAYAVAPKCRRKGSFEVSYGDVMQRV
jgi:hypothetical protein